jgi:hypothetical protein
MTKNNEAKQLEAQPLTPTEQIILKAKTFKGGKGLLRLMDEYLVANDLERSTKKRTHHYPTDMGSCARQMWYKWNNTPISDMRTAVDIWRMNLGSIVHLMPSEIFKALKIEMVDELPIDKHFPELKYKISGRMDNVVAFHDKLYVLEFKTTFGRGTKAIQESGQPREKDFQQASSYPAMSDAIDGLYLIYLGRDNFYRTEFFYSKDVAEVGRKAAIEYFTRIEKFIHQPEEPKVRDYTCAIKNGEIKDKVTHDKVEYRSAWQCTYCQWRSRCYAPEIKDSERGKVMYYGGEMYATR